MDLNKNYYEILGVSKTASEEEIKKAYKKLALQHHPDRNNGDKSSEDKFKEVNEAQQVLTGEEKQKYDMMSPHGASYNPGMGGGGFRFHMGGFDGMPFTGDPFFDDILRQHFNFGGGGRRNSTVYEALDIAITVNINISDTYLNKTIPIKYLKNIKCNTCGGSGFNHSSESSICTSCSGGGRDQYGIVCITCNGSGKVYKEQCNTCKGERTVQSEMTFNIGNTYKIESDIDNVYPGQGHHSKYYNKVGALHMTIRFINDTDYRRSPQGLISNLNLHFQDAIDGINYEHHHLDGNKLIIKIPAGTKDKDLIRIKDKGMLIDGVNREPLIFRVNIVIDYDRVKACKKTKK